MAKVADIQSHEQSDVMQEGAASVKMRMLVGPKEAAPTFFMRHFEVAAGGHTPHHTHDFEHEVLIWKGRGTVRTEQGDKPVEAGTVVYVPPNEKHQFVNDSDALLEFICLIPAPEDCCK